MASRIERKPHSQLLTGIQSNAVRVEKCARQRLINSVLTEMQRLKCLIYLDVIVIYGANLEDHNKRLEEVLQRLQENKLKLQLD